MTKILGADMLPLIRQKLPTKTSQLTNDSGFITSSSLSNLVPNTRTVNGKALSSDIALGAADVGALPTDGNAVSATKLATARTFRTNLASTSAASFNGSANVTPGVTGTLPISNGGTGATTAAAALSALGAQPTLVSGTNIKGINQESLLGSGSIRLPVFSKILTNRTGTGTLNIPNSSVINALNIINIPSSYSGLYLMYIKISLLVPPSTDAGVLRIYVIPPTSTTYLAYEQVDTPANTSTTANRVESVSVITFAEMEAGCRIRISTTAALAGIVLFNQSETGENTYAQMLG